MEGIAVREVAETASGWRCRVTVGTGRGATQHTVTVDRAYWEELTGGETEPKVLVEKSFVFLLQRESKTSIMRKFNLGIISRYFPEYEKEIGNLLGN